MARTRPPLRQRRARANSAVRILHTSDLHGNWRLPMRFQDFDLWVDSGDWFPNISRGTVAEAPFQNCWMKMSKLSLRKSTFPTLRRLHGSEGGRWYPPESRQPPFEGSIARELTAWLAGRPAFVVPGNHDYADLASCLRGAGATAVDLTKGPAAFRGLRFAGISEINWIEGEWRGEAHEPEIRVAVERVMSLDPEVLVTHAPPNGILDLSDSKGGHVGLSALTQWLQWRPHSVRLVLCGHVHEQPHVVQEMDVTFSNAAQSARILEI